MDNRDLLYKHRITVLKDAKRRSKGVAFVHYLKEEDAHSCWNAIDNTEV